MPLLDILRRHKALPLARRHAPSAPTEPDLAHVPQVPDVDIVVAAVDEPRIKTKACSPHRALPSRGSTGGGGGAVRTAAHLRWRTCAGASPRVGEARQAVPQPQQAAPSALLVDHQPRAPRPAMARLLVLHASEGTQATTAHASRSRCFCLIHHLVSVGAQAKNAAVVEATPADGERKRGGALGHEDPSGDAHGERWVRISQTAGTGTPRAPQRAHDPRTRERERRQPPLAGSSARR